MAEDIRERFLKHRTYAQSRRAKQGDRYYNPFGEGSYPYESTFQDLLLHLGVGSFSDLINERFSQTGKHQFILDLMAPPSSFLHHLVSLEGFGGGVAVTLGKESDPQGVMTTISGKGIYAVAGDLFRGKTWSKIDEGIKEIQVPDNKVDLIVCRAEGPFTKHDPAESFLFEDLPVLSVVLQRAWSRLTQNQGMIFTQLPRMYKHDTSYMELLRLIPIVAKQNGVDIEVSLHDESQVDAEPNLRITRTPNSPANFPRILQRSFSPRDLTKNGS